MWYWTKTKNETKKAVFSIFDNGYWYSLVKERLDGASLGCPILELNGRNSKDVLQSIRNAPVYYGSGYAIDKPHWLLISRDAWSGEEPGYYVMYYPVSGYLNHELHFILK